MEGAPEPNCLLPTSGRGRFPLYRLGSSTIRRFATYLCSLYTPMTSDLPSQAATPRTGAAFRPGLPRPRPLLALMWLAERKPPNLHFPFGNFRWNPPLTRTTCSDLARRPRHPDFPSSDGLKTRLPFWELNVIPCTPPVPLLTALPRVSHTAQHCTACSLHLVTYNSKTCITL